LCTYGDDGHWGHCQDCSRALHPGMTVWVLASKSLTCVSPCVRQNTSPTPSLQEWCLERLLWRSCLGAHSRLSFVNPNLLGGLDILEHVREAGKGRKQGGARFPTLTWPLSCFLILGIILVGLVLLVPFGKYCTAL
jgi:hypothetical protein